MTVGQGCAVVKAVFTFDALALVPQHRHKTVLLSDIGYSKSCSTMQCSSTSTLPDFWCEYLEKRYVHISAQQESHSGTMLNQQA